MKSWRQTIAGDAMTARTNTLLRNLPESEFRILTARMKLVSLKKGRTLFQQGEVPRHVYFPIGAVISMMNDSSNGLALETHVLGKTCMVGLGTLGHPSFYRAHVRGSGLAYELDVDSFQAARVMCPTFQKNGYNALIATLIQTTQSIACAKRHSSEQQLIRWLLITLDRSVTSYIQITHRELAEILGFRREVITKNLGRMAEQGELALRRGVVEVLKRDVLENRACECYWIGQPREWGASD
jgi:CRP-like cAMP-binding protein